MSQSDIPAYSDLLWPTIVAVRRLGGSRSIDEIADARHPPNPTPLTRTSKIRLMQGHWAPVVAWFEVGRSDLVLG
jgi:hypothetical protein